MGVMQDIKKALLTTADFGDFGLKTTQDIKRFIHQLRKQPNLFKSANVFPMKERIKTIPKILFSGRLLNPAAEGAALTAAQQKAPSFESVEVSTFKCMGEIVFTEEDIEDNLVGENLKDDLRLIIEQKVSEDLAELFWNGDTASADPFLAQCDGFLKLATSHSYDFLNNVMSRTRLANAYRELPVQYKRKKSDLTYFIHPELAFDYQETLTTLATALGDRAKIQDITPPFMGINIGDSPMINTYLNGADTNTEGLLTIAKNLLIGIYRDFRIRLIPNEYAETFTLHVSCRVGCNFMEEDAVVVMENIKHT